MRTVENLTLTIGQTAQTLGMSEYTFRKKRAALVALGFPAPLPGLRVYSRPAVEAWFRTNGGQLSAPAIEPTVSIELDEARQVLEGEYAA